MCAELWRQQSGPKHYPIGVNLSARHPARNCRTTLGEPQNPQPDLLALHFRKDFVIHDIQIPDVIFDFTLTIFRRHPGCTNRSIGSVRSSLRWREVITRERFRGDEQPVRALDGNKPRQKARCELTVSMADDPYFCER
ncbi:MAG: hypothetical protein QOD47_2079 [Gemmatimonadaceae bacterium]|nr:hypothetical protein [Gemmatimonadaceae bacterium]